MVRRIGALFSKFLTCSTSEEAAHSANKGVSSVIKAALIAGGDVDEAVHHRNIREETVDAVLTSEEKPVIIKDEEGQPMVYLRERDAAGRLSYVPTGVTPAIWDETLAQYGSVDPAPKGRAARAMGCLGSGPFGVAPAAGLLGGALVVALGIGGVFNGATTAVYSLFSTLSRVIKWVITFALAGLGVALVARIAKSAFSRNEDEAEWVTQASANPLRSPVQEFAPSRDQQLKPRTRDEAIDIASHIELSDTSGGLPPTASDPTERDISRG